MQEGQPESSLPSPAQCGGESLPDPAPAMPANAAADEVPPVISAIPASVPIPLPIPLPILTTSGGVRNTAKLRQRNIQIQAMHSMDRVTDEEDQSSVLAAAEQLRRRRPSQQPTSNGTGNEEQEVDNGSGGTVAGRQRAGAEMTDDGTELETQLVVVFASTVPAKTLHWIVDKIRGKRAHGGAELLLRMEPQEGPNDGLVLHVSVRSNKMLQIADELEIMKRTKSGIMQNFNVSRLDDFFLDDTMDIDDVLTLADRQLIVKHALDSIRAGPADRQLPGLESQVQFYHGESVVARCLQAGVIESVYALHDKEFLHRLEAGWCGMPTDDTYRQPLDTIREYFGEGLGIYFAFAEYHTLALIVPAILGIFQYFLSVSCVPYFCVFYVIWLTCYLEIWKRKCSTIAYRWGTIYMTDLDTPRIDFRGKLARDPVTGRMQPQYPIWRTYAIMYCVSVPLCVLAILPAAALAVVQFWLEDQVAQMAGAESYWTLAPGVVCECIVIGCSMLYERLATWLTDCENHRTQAKYERHRVAKMIALEFVNNFLCLFYIVFWLQEVHLIGAQLMIQLVTFQVVQKLMCTVYPIAMGELSVVLNSWMPSPSAGMPNRLADLNVQALPPDDARIEQNRRERRLPVYTTYDDYMEMYVQFGYVVMFASVAPLAAVAALLNSLIEIRLDAFKLCRIYRRPLARRAKNTGAWLLAFESLLVMSIITNCALLYLQPEVKEMTANRSHQDVLLAFIVVEHLMLALAWAINQAIPDRPHWVRVALAKANYESRQAVKRENAQLTRNVLFRRFYSVHDYSQDPPQSSVQQR